MSPTVPYNHQQTLQILRLSSLVDKNNLDTAITICKLLKEHMRQEKEPRLFAQPWLLRRVNFGVYKNLLKDLASEDAPAYNIYRRMDIKLFKKALSCAVYLVEKQDTTFRQSNTTCPQISH